MYGEYFEDIFPWPGDRLSWSVSEYQGFTVEGGRSMGAEEKQELGDGVGGFQGERQGAFFE